MSDLSLDYSSDLLGQPSYGDLKLYNGDLILTNDVNPQGTDAIMQNVCQRLRLFLGEFFMDTSAGVPWFQQILVKNADPADVDGVLRDAILGTAGVTALLNYTSNQDRSKRQYTVNFTVLTATGRKITASVPSVAPGATP